MYQKSYKMYPNLDTFYYPLLVPGFFLLIEVFIYFRLNLINNSFNFSCYTTYINNIDLKNNVNPYVFKQIYCNGLDITTIIFHFYINPSVIFSAVSVTNMSTLITT